MTDKDPLAAKLSGQLEILIKTFERSNDEARKSRKAIYDRINLISDRLNNMSERITVLEARMGHVETDVQDIAPVVNRAKKLESGGKGALAALGIVMTAAGGLLVYFGDIIRDRLFGGS
ncbi:DUF1515 family protein [Kaustia mangrovi]|uniref:DUF1515 family protein n=1 Tax=Kaustia mangrovi TaxID=2593653 RepID=A0A7S8C5Z5_9HYPH|nr:DUF1515 family protein [Kaustia mangrovi]QPC44020.1 DUF1515 family protein [Kaustia mangrovi]